MSSPFKETTRTDEEQKAFRKGVLNNQRIYFNTPLAFCSYTLLGLISGKSVRLDELATHHIVPYRWAEVQGRPKEEINDIDNGIPVHWPVHKHRIHPRTHELIKAVGASLGIAVTREAHYERVNINCCTKASQDVAAECFEEVMRRAETSPGLRKTLQKPVHTGEQKDYDTKKWFSAGYRYNQRTREYEPWSGQAFIYVWEQYQIDHSLKIAHEHDERGERIRTLYPGIQVPEQPFSIIYPTIPDATTFVPHSSIAIGGLLKNSGVMLYTPAQPATSIALPEEQPERITTIRL